MKKKRSWLDFFGYRVRKLVCIMKLTAFIMLLILCQARATTYGQSEKIDLNLEGATLKMIFDEIENQSNYNLFYNKSIVNERTKISVEMKEASVNEVLAEVLGSTDIKYQIVGNDILLSRKERMIVSQSDQIKVKGLVSDPEGIPLPGVTVRIEGSTQGVITDPDGKYSIDVSPTDKLRFTFIGMDDQVIDVNGRTTINVMLQEKSEELEGVTIVAFGKQEKKAIVGSVSSIRPDELKVPSSNLTNALAGRVSGVISYQRSGEPGQDNSEFFIRGVTTFGYTKSPLILIDGIELTSKDFARLQPDDIASFSILKDATATAVYGARGANGVILVTTKEGKEGKLNIKVRYEHSISTPTDKIDIADPVTFMQLYNEGVKTRDAIGTLPYSERKIENTKRGLNPYQYPAVRWNEELIKNQAQNDRINLNLSGGGKKMRYFLSAAGSIDRGILKVDKVNDFNSNIDLKKLSVRSNVNISLTNTTEAVLRFNGTFDDYRGPIDGGSDLFKKTLRANPVLFPKYYPRIGTYEFTDHMLFGNYGEAANYLNPYADLVRGYKESSRTLVLAQLELKQDLSFITEGLSFRTMINTTRTSYFDVTREIAPFYYSYAFTTPAGEQVLEQLNEEKGRAYLDYEEGNPSLQTTFYLQNVLSYNRTFNENHTFGGQLIQIVRSSLRNQTKSFQQSLPYRNLGLSGRTTYGYLSKYFLEFNFGYNGSERFSKKERFGFFPSLGCAWTISEEDFFINLKSTVNKFKFKASYGLVGNDAIGDKNDRFFYLAQVTMDNNKLSSTFGEELGYKKNGISIDRYANPLVSWETAKKLNTGFEIGLFDNKISINADYFREDRTNILMERAFIPPSLGLEAKVKANVGEARSQGFDASLDLNHVFANGLQVAARANFTYSANELLNYEEPNYDSTPWLYHSGQSIGQEWGFVAERLFIDEEEVFNSPRQFGVYGAGDIKYKDINKDGVIDFKDKVPIGHPKDPELLYGFGFSGSYKGFDLSCFFQGLGRTSFWIEPGKVAPFIDPDTANKVRENNAILQVFADDHWSEQNQDVYAIWPRLSVFKNENNQQRSTWFMQNGSFLRLKQVECGYTFSTQIQKRLGVRNLRLYVNATNLLTFSKFKLWDPEMAGNGLGYPVQKVFNIGLQVTL